MNYIYCIYLVWGGGGDMIAKKKYVQTSRWTKTKGQKFDPQLSLWFGADGLVEIGLCQVCWWPSLHAFSWWWRRFGRSLLAAVSGCRVTGSFFFPSFVFCRNVPYCRPGSCEDFFAFGQYSWGMEWGLIVFAPRMIYKATIVKKTCTCTMTQMLASHQMRRECKFSIWVSFFYFKHPNEVNSIHLLQMHLTLHVIWVYFYFVWNVCVRILKFALGMNPVKEWKSLQF